MEASLMHHDFEIVLCTESTELQLKSILNYFTFNYQMLHFDDRGNRRIERKNLTKIKHFRNLCIKSILFQAYMGEIYLRL